MGSRYRLPPGALLRIGTVSGSVRVIAEDRDDLEVEPPDRRVEIVDGGRVAETRSRSGSLLVRCPTGTHVSVGAISGSISLEGHFGSAKVSTVSGHIQVDSVSGDVDVRSVSGHLSVNKCGGRCHLNTKSGHISVGQVAKEARASTISGSVELGTEGREDVHVRTISGRVVVRVAQGKHPHPRVRTLSGRVSCDCPQGSDFDIKASTLSGSVTITER
ncbi:MAG: DUF4097 family beta strand repeat-containing protein [Dehalococcoidia bacterium]|nr:DUF4097 family beta strand repeat-containing protein [Dehalococcoidia bacterium]